MNVKFMLQLPKPLRISIKHESRKLGITMNEYIVTVLGQFVAIQKRQNYGKQNAERADTRVRLLILCFTFLPLFLRFLLVAIYLFLYFAVILFSLLN